MRGRQRLERILVFWSHEWNLKLAPVIIVNHQMVGRKEDVGIVRSKQVATNDNLDSFGSRWVVLVDYSEVNRNGGKLRSRTVRLGRRRDGHGFWQIDCQLDLPATIIVLSDLILKAEMVDEMQI